MSTNSIKAQLVMVALTHVFDTRKPSRLGAHVKIVRASGELDRPEGQELQWHAVNQQRATIFADRDEISQFEPGQVLTGTLCEDSSGTLFLKKGSVKLHERKAEEKPEQLRLF